MLISSLKHNRSLPISDVPDAQPLELTELDLAMQVIRSLHIKYKELPTQATSSSRISSLKERLFWTQVTIYVDAEGNKHTVLIKNSSAIKALSFEYGSKKMIKKTLKAGTLYESILKPLIRKPEAIAHSQVTEDPLQFEDEESPSSEEFALKQLPLIETSIVQTIQKSTFTPLSVQAINDYLQQHPEHYRMAQLTEKNINIDRKNSKLDRSMYITPKGDVIVRFTRHKALRDWKIEGGEKVVSKEYSLITGECHATVSLKFNQYSEAIAKNECHNLKKYNGKRGFIPLINHYSYTKTKHTLKLKERITLPFCELGDLSHAITKRNLSKEDIKNIILDLEECLGTLHEKASHGDIKPENILLTRDSNGKIHAYLTDLSSVCKKTAQNNMRTFSSLYLSPEAANQYVHDHKLTESDREARDIWAYGVTLYLLLGMAAKQAIVAPWVDSNPHDTNYDIIKRISKITSEKKLESLISIITDKTSPEYVIQEIMQYDEAKRPGKQQRDALWAEVNWEKWLNS